MMINRLIEQANELLTGGCFEYAFCGGCAVDLFLGYESRKHSDIDILAFWAERDLIILYMQSIGFITYEMLGGGKAHHITDIQQQRKEKRNIFCFKKDCELLNLSGTDEKDIYEISFKQVGQTKLNFIEFLFNDKEEDVFLYARNHDVKRNLRDAILHHQGIPYLAPEICLLYKSTDIEREGYQQDYEKAISVMDKDQTNWFDNAMQVLYPNGHRWNMKHIIEE